MLSEINQMEKDKYHMMPRICGTCESVLSHTLFFLTARTAARKAPLSMGFSRKNTGVGCHFLFHGIFPTPGWNPCLLHWQADSLPLRYLERPNSYRQKVECWLAGIVGRRGNRSCCLMSNSVFLQDGKSSRDLLHNNVNVDF